MAQLNVKSRRILAIWEGRQVLKTGRMRLLNAEPLCQQGLDVPGALLRFAGQIAKPISVKLGIEALPRETQDLSSGCAIVRRV